MALIDGGTRQDLVRTRIHNYFSFQPKGTKVSIDDIARSLSIDDTHKIIAMRIEADWMAEHKWSHQCGEGTYLFTKDEPDRYYWKKAGIIDTVRVWVSTRRYLD